MIGDEVWNNLNKRQIKLVTPLKYFWYKHVNTKMFIFLIEIKVIQ